MGVKKDRKNMLKFQDMNLEDKEEVPLLEGFQLKPVQFYLIRDSLNGLYSHRKGRSIGSAYSYGVISGKITEKNLLSLIKGVKNTFEVNRPYLMDYIGLETSILEEI